MLKPLLSATTILLSISACTAEQDILLPPPELILSLEPSEATVVVGDSTLFTINAVNVGTDVGCRSGEPEIATATLLLDGAMERCLVRGIRPGSAQIIAFVPNEVDVAPDTARVRVISPSEG